MPPRWFLTVLFGLAALGCARTVWPVTTGWHVPGDGLLYGQHRPERYVIWANHPALAQEITRVLMIAGHTIVERGELDRLMAEQKLRLTSTPDADLLRVGALVGATQVIFAQVIIVRVADWPGAPGTVTVNLRAVQVETGAVRWVGTAGFPVAIAHPDRTLPMLTSNALTHAGCEVERGWHWADGRPQGCQPPAAVAPGRDRAEPSIWQDLRSMEKTH